MTTVKEKNTENIEKKKRYKIIMKSLFPLTATAKENRKEKY